ALLGAGPGALRRQGVGRRARSAAAAALLLPASRTGVCRPRSNRYSTLPWPGSGGRMVRSRFCRGTPVPADLGPAPVEWRRQLLVVNERGRAQPPRRRDGRALEPPGVRPLIKVTLTWQVAILAVGDLVEDRRHEQD